MSEEFAGNALTGAEGSPPSVPSSVETPPAEPTPQYLTRQEALNLMAEQRAELERAAADFGQRGAQSFIDRGRLNERLNLVQKALTGLVQSGQLDGQTASATLQDARWEALTDVMPATPEPQPARPAQSDMHPLMRQAYQRMESMGITRGHPAFVDPQKFDNPLDWRDALDSAVAKSTARAAREQAQLNAQAAQPAGNPQRPVPTGAAAIEVGGSVPGATAGLEQLRQQRIAAYRPGGDKSQIPQLDAEIDRLQKAGG
jgi:uncharacterized protein (DUF1501 family)